MIMISRRNVLAVAAAGAVAGAAPNADEWQYYIEGKARMTVFNTGPNAMTMDFNAGDIGYVRRNLGHYVENVGDTDLQFIGVFKASRYEEVSLSNWLTHPHHHSSPSIRMSTRQPLRSGPITAPA